MGSAVEQSTEEAAHKRAEHTELAAVGQVPTAVVEEHFHGRCRLP